VQDLSKEPSPQLPNAVYCYMFNSQERKSDEAKDRSCDNNVG
jgi:hypothetical protein